MHPTLNPKPDHQAKAMQASSVEFFGSGAQCFGVLGLGVQGCALSGLGVQGSAFRGSGFSGSGWGLGLCAVTVLPGRSLAAEGLGCFFITSLPQLPISGLVSGG